MLAWRGSVKRAGRTFFVKPARSPVGGGVVDCLRAPDRGTRARSSPGRLDVRGVVAARPRVPTGTITRITTMARRPTITIIQQQLIGTITLLQVRTSGLARRPVRAGPTRGRCQHDLRLRSAGARRSCRASGADDRISKRPNPVHGSFHRRTSSRSPVRRSNPLSRPASKSARLIT